MSQPHVVCVDVTPHPFDEFDDKPTLSETVLRNCVRMVYDTAALGDEGVRKKGANVFAVFIGISSCLRFGFFYNDVSHVDESLNAALARCMQTQTDRLLTEREDRWGDLDVPFCYLLSGSATQRPADEVMHAGAALLSEIKCDAGKVLDYVCKDGQTVAVVVGKGVLPRHVGAAVARAIRDGTCVAMYCREDVHPCDKTSVFWLALEALRAFTWSKTPVALPEVPEAPAPRKCHKPNAPARKPSIFKSKSQPRKEGQKYNFESVALHVRTFCKDESVQSEDLPVTNDVLVTETDEIQWAEPPHREKQTGFTDREKQSAQWEQAGWKCIETKTMQFDEEHTVQSWQHDHYGAQGFSRSDMKNAVLQIDHENNVFARNRFHPVSSHSRGPDALFRRSDSTEHLTRATVRARITAKENAVYEAAGFTCALVDDELRFCEGGVMPTTEQWSHETYEAGSTFARNEMPKALRCLEAAQAVPQGVQDMFWQQDKKAKTDRKPGF